ncbi:MAG: CotH kinase family protein, partial [Firmicutes bacterium]|nr:CotH kinase family protein [Bacillota bacterium]
MIASKHFSKIVAAVVIIALLFCGLAMAFSDKLQSYTASGVTMEYESELFDTSEIIDINIIMSEEDWNDLLENAIDEEYYSCDVVVNGTTFTNVGIRAKGNTSLSNIANDPDTDRYSLKLEFDHYVEGQTCFGLDKLILNNNYADATNMKEALVYDMYQYLGADASLYNYAKINVNGEYWGVYLALEAVDDSFMLRNYGTQDGELYKPESMDMS